MLSLALTLLLAAGGSEISASPDPPPSSLSKQEESIRSIAKNAGNTLLYYGMGKGLESLSLFAKFGGRITQILPWSADSKKEWLLFSELCHLGAEHILRQLFARRPPPSNIGQCEGISPSCSSWYLNQKLLSQIPTFSTEEKELLHFLRNHWLAKATGFFPFVINSICPCFGILMQVHPETTSSYARNPGTNFSQTYENRVEAWKRLLPHPEYFPLILTRPFDLHDYLPHFLKVSALETMQELGSRLLKEIAGGDTKVVLDLTGVLPSIREKGELWVSIWEKYRAALLKTCEEHALNARQILCIQSVKQDEIGGVRLLPLVSQKRTIEEQHRFLLEWISLFGLSANRVELDRLRLPDTTRKSNEQTSHYCLERSSKELFLSSLNAFEMKWMPSSPQKDLMVGSSLKLLREAITGLSQEKWQSVQDSQTRLLVAETSFRRIEKELDLLLEKNTEALFFEIASHIEEIHAHLSTLLEILSPFNSADFPPIYKNLLKAVPSSVQPMISSTLHASGMTSVTGIFKAVEKMTGKRIRILYGENAYFECINASHRIGDAASVQEAKDEDWKEVDLILAQFNPALKRIGTRATIYNVEKVREVLHRSFNSGRSKPLTLALDCTFDMIDSPRVGKLLEEFQAEIKAGILNVIGYRSGLKFDLFGMDNYAGAPLFMIHNDDSKWSPFDLLLTDPVLQTDRHSLNWFCLAYKSSAPFLESYRKQIFENTRAFLCKVPTRLFDPHSRYRIVPVADDADSAFLDIKISGAFHKIRGAFLGGGSLYLACMEKGHPIFYRPSVGFYHPNFTMLFGEQDTTIRLTLGLDPSEVDLLVDCFTRIDQLNGS